MKTITKKDLYELEKLLDFYNRWAEVNFEIFQQTNIHDKEAKAHNYLRKKFYPNKAKDNENLISQHLKRWLVLNLLSE